MNKGDLNEGVGILALGLVSGLAAIVGLNVYSGLEDSKFENKIVKERSVEVEPVVIMYVAPKIFSQEEFSMTVRDSNGKYFVCRTDDYFNRERNGVSQGLDGLARAVQQKVDSKDDKKIGLRGFFGEGRVFNITYAKVGDYEASIPREKGGERK